MFARRLRAPSVLLWVVGLALAALVGLAIAGPPGGAKDVPLRDRGVPEGETGCGPEDVTCFFGSTTTSTTTSPTASAPATTSTSTTSTTVATEETDETEPADTETTDTEPTDTEPTTTEGPDQ